MKVFEEKETALKYLNQIGATTEERKEFELNSAVKIKGELICLSKIFKN